MDTNTDLKREIHSLIDLIQDEQVLKAVHVILKKEAQTLQDFWMQLNENERQHVSRGLEQLQQREKVTHQEVKNLYQIWL